MSNVFGLLNKSLSRHLKIKIFDNLLKIYRIHASLPILHWYFWLKCYAEERKPKWLKSTLRYHSEIV